MLSLNLWRQGPFTRFVLGATLSTLGTWFNTVALAVLSYQLTGQISSVAATLVASVLPRVILSPIAGVLADRFERRSLLVALDLGSALVALTPLLVHNQSLLPLLYASVFLLQTAACLYRPAQMAYLGHLVPDELLEAANAAFSTMMDVAMFVGPALAAVVLGLGGPATGFWGNGASFLLSAALLLTLPRLQGADERVPQIAQLVAGYVGIVRCYPRVTALYGLALTSTVPIYFFQGIMVAYVARLGQPSTFIGALYAAAGVGGILGGMAMGQWQRRLSPTHAAILCGAQFPLLGALALVHAALIALIVLAASTAAAVVGDLIFDVRVQRYVPMQERGRAFGLLFWCIALGQLLGAVLGMAVSTAASVPALLWVSAGVFPVACGSLLYFVRSTDDVAAQPVAAVA